MNLLGKLLLKSVGVLLAAYLLPGVSVASFWSALVLAIVLSVLNTVIKPILIVLTIPVTIVSLGLFLFVINALMVLLADSMISGFYVNGFWWGLLFSLILSVINWVLIDMTEKK